MSELGEVLQAFLEATGSDAVVWRRDGGEGTPLRFIAGTRRTTTQSSPPLAPCSTSRPSGAGS
jgi:hypothetical protein